MKKELYDAATELDECALPGHAGCMRVTVDGRTWIDHLPAGRDAALAAVERVRAVLAEERAWLEHLVESGDAMSRNVIGIGKVEAALENGDDK